MGEEGRPASISATARSGGTVDPVATLRVLGPDTVAVCYDRAVLRSWVAAALLSALLGSMFTTVLAPAGEGCTEEACRCAHHRDSKPRSSLPCHERARAAERDCEIQGTCAHVSPMIVSPRPYLVPDVAQAALSRTAEILDPPRDCPPLAGILRIDSPPPKAS
jgi:hypothetical protein